MNQIGRPRNPEGLISSHITKKMPKKETEIMKQMRATYLAMGRNRSYKAISDLYGYSQDWVSGIARAFRWVEDAQIRDDSIQNTFVEEHQRDINRAQKLAFISILKDLEVEAAKRGFIVEDSGIIKNLSEMEGGPKKALDNVLNSKHIPLNSHKELNDLLNALKKVVYEWNPSLDSKSILPKGTRIEGNVNVCNLIIEK